MIGHKLCSNTSSLWDFYSLSLVCVWFGEYIPSRGQFSSLPSFYFPTFHFLEGTLSGLHFVSTQTSRQAGTNECLSSLNDYLISIALIFTTALVGFQITRGTNFVQCIQLYSGLGERGFADLFILPDQKFYLVPDAGIMFFLRDLKGLPFTCDIGHHFLTGGHLLLHREKWSAIRPVCS